MIDTAIEQKEITPNKKQFKCIQTLEGPVMVLAGPGTGKTFTIIQRINHMLKQGILPENILCLTFSDAAANEMKARLVKEMGTLASAVTIHTFHAFCNEIIQQFPAHFELLDGVNLIDEINKRTLMKQVLDEYNPEFYRTRWGNTDHYISDLIEAVNEIKKNQVKKEQYFDFLNSSSKWQGEMDRLLAEKEERETHGKAMKTFLGKLETHERKMGKAKEAWDIYERYDLKLKENNFIDFNDMINLVLERFERDENFLKKVAKRYTYFLVDEYQDTNYSQNQLVFMLAEGGGNKNVFVVGDDDQIIYGFQGARTDNLENFILKYPDTNIICLNENNRSAQTILDLSYEIISQDKLRLESKKEFAQYGITKRLTAKNPDVIALDKKAEIHSFGDIKQENNFIVQRIKELTAKQTDYSQIAILTRFNKEIEEFSSLLKAQNIPYQIKSTKNIFELRPSILIYFYLKAMENNELYSDKLFGLLLSNPFDFEKSDYNFLLEQNRLNHKDFITNIRKNINKEWTDADKIKNFITVYDELCELRSHESLKNILIEVINRTGILEYYLKSDINKIENIAAIKRLVDEAVTFSAQNKAAGLSDFIVHLNTAFNNDIDIKIASDEYVQNAVQLLTLHGAKGREFEYVFIPNLTAKNWEKKRSPNDVDLPIEKVSFSEDEEEAKKAEQLRLLFVGITRSKHSLFLSYSNSINNKPQELTSYLANCSNNPKLFNSDDHPLKEEDLTNEVGKSFISLKFDYHKAFIEELKARLKDFKFSPSSLNTYLNCKRQFLYSKILCIPVKDDDDKEKVYGNAVHKTLEWVVNNGKEEKEYPTLEKLLEAYNKKLASQMFETESIREEYRQRGLNSLKGYYSKFIETPLHNIMGTEFSFDYIPVEDYFIKGVIDRVERNNDNTFSLYDYKTGAAKAKSQIADGKDYEHYLNQLRFYKLAFETLNEGAKVSQVGLIFVEDPDKSYYTELCQEDNLTIRDKILSSYEGINALDFTPVDNQDKKSKSCEHCDYEMLCRLDVL